MSTSHCDALYRMRISGQGSPERLTPAYEQLVDEHSKDAVQIDRMPCSGGGRFENWCITGPPLPELSTPP